MFYSPTILAKKSPMGTVWMAAHLERKIKKAQIEKINIAVYAEKLLFPEVPIALRMSAHLLLGLVRIYAWKVDYTFSDCNRLLTDMKTAIVNIKIYHRVDANRAPPQSVTLSLDGIDLGVADDVEGFDGNQKTFDQITTTGEENYEPFGPFLIDENDSSSPSSHSSRGAEPMDDTLPPCNVHVQELIMNEKNAEAASGPNEQDILIENQSDDILRGSRFNIPNGNQSRDIPDENQFDAIPSIEKLRNCPSSLDAGDNRTGFTGQFPDSLNNNCNAARNDFSPVRLNLDASGEEMLIDPNEKLRQSLQRENYIPSPRSASMQLDELELAIAPSPPPFREKKKRKNIQFYYDTHIVLSNEKMKAQLRDPAVALLMCKRRKLPSSSLDAWRYQRARLKDQIFNQPLINWKFASLQENKTYPPITIEEQDMDPPVGPTQQSPNHGATIGESFINSPTGPIPRSPHHDIGTVEEPPINSPLGHPPYSPNHEISMAEPSIHLQSPSSNYDGMHIDEPPDVLRRFHDINETIPVSSPPVNPGQKMTNSNNNLFDSPSNALPTSEPEMLDSPRRNPPAKHVRLTSQSPSIPSHERVIVRTPQLQNSAEREDLNFLETPPSVKARRARTEDGNLSPRILENDSERKGLNSWSARSMGMAKYLREHLPVAPNLESQNGNISLNHILEGKTRKHCARMFFETLVLTTCEYIHVKQEESYGDVLIRPRPKLTRTKD